MKNSNNVDELLNFASKFSIGQLILSGSAQNLLVRLLQRAADRLLRPGDEIRQLNVSLKKKKDGDACVLLKRAKLGNSDCNRQLRLLLRNGSF